jgi:hypothetical protein
MTPLPNLPITGRYLFRLSLKFVALTFNGPLNMFSHQRRWVICSGFKAAQNISIATGIAQTNCQIAQPALMAYTADR